MAGFLNCVKFLRLSPAYIQFRAFSNLIEKNGLLLGVYSEENKQGFKLTAAAEKYNQLCDGKLCESLKLVEDKLKLGKPFIFWNLEKQYPLVAVVGLGSRCKTYNTAEQIDDVRESTRIAASAGCKALQDAGAKNICLDTLDDPEAAAEGATLGLYKFQECKSKQECPPKIGLFQPSDCPSQNDILLWNTGICKATAQNQARRLADMPSNLMTPTIFGENVEEMFSGLDVAIKIHDEKWAQSQNMNAFLAVAKGSCEPPKFIELSYSKGCEGDGPIVLVGKGVTFDSGGISIKPSASMDHMRADMGGAAACVAALRSIATCNIQTNIRVLIPLCENMPSGSAVKPGDVVKAMNGKTIGINNTDAEGRLILADALTYSGCFDPKMVVDLATLTGAMKMSLGSTASGVFTNSDKLYKSLVEAGAKSGDRVWRFPLWKHYTKEVTDSPGYDVNNIGKGKGGGACSAAAFLKEFVPKSVDWIHMDIAGVAGPDSEIPYLGKGMTGRPTRTLIEFIRNQSNS